MTTDKKRFDEKYCNSIKIGLALLVGFDHTINHYLAFINDTEK